MAFETITISVEEHAARQDEAIALRKQVKRLREALTVMEQQEPVAWMCSSEALLRMGYQKFSTTCSGDWNIPVYAGHQGAQAAVPEGWQLVPIEPTEEMLERTSAPGCAASDWANMIAAAPKPEGK